MNARQLAKLGVPNDCTRSAVVAIQSASKASQTSGIKRNFKKLIPEIVATPENFVNDPAFGELAQALIEDRDFVRPEPIGYKIFGEEMIEQGAMHQMNLACTMPNARAAAMMPDSHSGYGIPVGGVLALENAVSCYAVGVDIACRMKLTVLDLPVPEKPLWTMDKIDESLEKGTRFGMGCEYQRSGRKNHEVMDKDWNVSRITRERKDVAWQQLGTSGGGNHFVEYGLVELFEGNDLGLPAGQYVSLMSHSGSRGVGSAVCNYYSAIAQENISSKYDDLAKAKLGWLSMDSEAGQEYWAAMNLMGEYASACHDVIHKTVSKIVGANIIGSVENHHNFAWKEVHQGKELYVHRKGATPAGKGVLGVIPGSMGDHAYIVRGKGNPDSLESASHGAGRCMSRTAGKAKYNFKAVKYDLEKKGIRVLQAGADEVPGVYKDIETVMAAQTDLVDIIGKFHPKVVMMAGEETQVWRKRKRVPNFEEGE